MHNPVNTKADFVKRFIKGEFGNKTPSWNNLDEYLDDPISNSYGDDPYHIRNREKGGHTFYHIPQVLLPKFVRQYIEEGLITEGKYYLSQMIPRRIERRLVIQGEVHQTPNYVDLYYSTIPTPMRDSLALGGKQITGYRAWATLRYCLCPRSFEWLSELLDRYPKHVVEFSTYSTCWGTLHGYNTVFWEVRNY